ncbi:GTP cyclohydrolase II, partial [bacterium]|nr:GTP cyclohydrolase II [bacterium]
LSLFQETSSSREHLVLWMGDWNAPGRFPLIRIHSECLTGDVFGSLRCDCGQQLADAMRQISREGCGAVLYLRQEGRGIGLSAKLQAYGLQDQGMDTVEANLALGFAADERDFSIAAELLKMSGVESIRLMTNNPAKIEALEHAGVKVVERIASLPSVQHENSRYLKTKIQKMRHLISLETLEAADHPPVGEG